MEYVLRRKRYIFLILAALLVSFIISHEATLNSGQVRVDFLNVGQGDAIFIQSPSGNQVLYDAGPPSGAVLHGLSEVMRFYDKSIDVIILSHPDLDHTGGFPEILRRYDVALALEPGIFSGNGAYELVKRELDTAKVKQVNAQEGMLLELGGGARIYILYPDVVSEDMDTNDASIVALLEYGKTRLILSGDLTSKYEEKLAARYGTLMDVDIVKLGHHGSRTSTSMSWLTATTPSVAIISRGIDNRYGHPHKEVIDRLAELKIPYRDTAVDGRLSYVSNGEAWVQIK